MVFFFLHRSNDTFKTYKSVGFQFYMIATPLKLPDEDLQGIGTKINLGLSPSTQTNATPKSQSRRGIAVRQQDR